LRNFTHASKFNKTTHFDAIIIGGGAAELMCAVQAGFLGKRVLVLEKNDRVGAKILIAAAAGATIPICTHRLTLFRKTSISVNRRSRSGRLMIPLVFLKRMVLKEKKKHWAIVPEAIRLRCGKGFTDLCDDLGQDIWCNADVKGIEKIGDGFIVSFERNGKEEKVTSTKVVIAAGAYYTKMGATDFGLRTARKFGLNIMDTAPALVPLTITGKDSNGMSSYRQQYFLQVGTIGQSLEENILFTHWGLSGPAICRYRPIGTRRVLFFIDLLPNENIVD